MNAARKVFPPGNSYGVIAFGIGNRRVRGQPLGGPTLQVLVEQKHRAPACPVPAVSFKYDSKMFSVQPDTIASGSPPCADQARRPGRFSGLHPGAAIKVGNRWWGAVGFLARAHDASGDLPTHLVTAGHLFPPNANGETVVAAEYDCTPIEVGHLTANLLDWLPRPPLFSMDAAAVELTPQGRRIAGRTRNPIRLTGIAPAEILGGVRAQAFLATSQDYSPITRTDIRPFDFPAMQSDARGPYRLRLVIRTQTAITLPGDSGTVLTSYSESRAALGLCIGAVGTGMSLFEPAFRALRYLSRILGQQLDFWMQP